MNALKVILVLLVSWTAWDIIQHPSPGGSQPLLLQLASWASVRTFDFCEIVGDNGIWDTKQCIRFNDDLFKMHQYKVKTERTMMDGVEVVLYYPNNRSVQDAGIITYHMGWYYGAAEVTAPSLARYAEQLSSVVVAVEYPLSPEASAKEIYDSCYRVAKHFIENSVKWNVDPQKIVLMGESGGANLAASVALQLRDNSVTPMPRLQVLIHGIYQFLDTKTPSMMQYTEGPIIHRPFMAAMYSSFITRDVGKYRKIFSKNTHVPHKIRDRYKNVIDHDLIPKEQRYPPYVTPDYKEDTKVDEFWEEFGDVFLDPYVSPLLVDTHTDLPEVLMISAQHDMFRDESYLYANALKKSGVSVTHHHNVIGAHIMLHFFEWFDDSEYDMNVMIELIRLHLNG